MKLKNKLAMLSFLLSLIFICYSTPFSGALSQGRMERAATARVVDDEDGLLKLKGFNNKSYDLNGSYTKFGSIVNNTNQIIILTVTIEPDYNIQNLSTRFNVKIGNAKAKFNSSHTSQKQVSISLIPGQAIDVHASLKQNFFSSLLVKFHFEASDLAGTYTMQLGDTIDTPRHILCY